MKEDVMEIVDLLIDLKKYDIEMFNKLLNFLEVDSILKKAEI